MLESPPALIGQIAFSPPIKTILVVKLDHIGDFFIALPALRRLREGFPDAHMTLVCGPWNRALASALGLFDEIINFDFFPEQSRNTSKQLNDPLWLARMHRRFAEMFDHPFDIAIDFRYDTNTRRMLTMVEATHRVGIGDFAEFPFLDVALPSDRQAVRPHPVENETIATQVEFEPNGGSQQVSAARKDLVIDFNIDAPAMPAQLCHSTDKRLLGIGLSRFKLTRSLTDFGGLYKEGHTIWHGAAHATVSRYRVEDIIEFGLDNPAHYELGVGWAEREAWGVWTEGTSASLRMPIEVGASSDLTLCLQVRAYTGPSKPRRLQIDVDCNGQRVSRVVFREPDDKGTLVIPLGRDLLERSETVVQSQPFHAGMGECSVLTTLDQLGDIDRSGHGSVTFEVVTATEQVLGHRRFAGADLAMIAVNAITFFHRDPGATLRLRVHIVGRPFRHGLIFNAVRIATSPKRYSPSMHIYDWSGALADLVIRRFAPGPTDLLDLPLLPLPQSVQDRLDADSAAGRPSIVIATGSNKDVTKWPLGYFSALVGRILECGPATVYLIGAPRESVDAERIVADHAPSNAVINLCGATTLMQLGSLYKHASLFIGGSTGTTHAAAMSGTPTIAIQSGTNDVQQWGPIGHNAVCLSLEVPCRQCHILHLSECNHGYRCMVELTPDLVFPRVRHMLPRLQTDEPDMKVPS